jgi:hypothetical protein
MPTTYEPIATQTVSGSSTGTVTFSSIPATYTDLVVVSNFGNAVAARLYLRFNGITTNTYSDAYLTGVGGGGYFTGRDSTQNAMTIGGAWNGFSTTLTATNILQVMNYGNTTAFKSIISRSANDKGNGTGSVDALVGLWQSTSAITSLSLIGGSNFLANSTFTLYGIKAA